MNLQINERVIKRMRALGISSEIMGSALFVLFALFEKRSDLLDKFDDNNREKRSFLLYKTLERKGFVETTDNLEDDHYQLSERGVELVQFVRSEMDEGFSIKGEMVRTEAFLPAAETEQVEAWIGEWIKLFPSEKTGGRYLRTNKTECADRMKWFIKTYSFDRDTIFRATENYLQTQETSPNGHTYTRNSSYFIFKGRNKHERTSDLATWCQRVVDGTETDVITEISSTLI